MNLRLALHPGLLLLSSIGLSCLLRALTLLRLSLDPILLLSFSPDTHAPEQHGGTDAMLVDESVEMPRVQASHQTVTTSTSTSSYPSMSATFTPTASWVAPFQPFSAMDIDPHWYGINFGSSIETNQIDDMAYDNTYANLQPQQPQYEASPRTLRLSNSPKQCSILLTH